jgi:hypothetical protein
MREALGVFHRRRYLPEPADELPQFLIVAGTNLRSTSWPWQECLTDAPNLGVFAKGDECLFRVRDGIGVVWYPVLEGVNAKKRGEGPTVSKKPSIHLGHSNSEQ